MCIGIPMRVVEAGEFFALCEGRGGRRRLNMMLVGAQPAGAWVLAFLDAAREVIEEERVAQINGALDALEAVMREERDLDRHFPGLLAGH